MNTTKLFALSWVLRNGHQIIWGASGQIPTKRLERVGFCFLTGLGPPSPSILGIGSTANGFLPCPCPRRGNGFGTKTVYLGQKLFNRRTHVETTSVFLNTNTL